MQNSAILKISFIIAILGILLLMFLSEIITPTQIKIKDITDDKLNQKIEIKGNITSIKTYSSSNFQITTLMDETGKIDITSEIINITKNQTIIVIGKITEYKKTLQISADKIST